MLIQTRLGVQSCTLVRWELLNHYALFLVSPRVSNCWNRFRAWVDVVIVYLFLLKEAPFKHILLLLLFFTKWCNACFIRLSLTSWGLRLFPCFVLLLRRRIDIIAATFQILDRAYDVSIAFRELGVPVGNGANIGIYCKNRPEVSAAFRCQFDLFRGKRVYFRFTEKIFENERIKIKI